MKGLVAGLSLSVLLVTACATMIAPVQATAYFDIITADVIDSWLQRATVEAQKRINFIDECRKYFWKLADWGKKEVRVFMVEARVTPESRWIARTYCSEDGGTYIVVKRDYVLWTIKNEYFNHLVTTLLHEFAHANTCPSFLTMEDGEGEDIAQAIEGLCQIPNPNDEAKRDNQSGQYQPRSR